MSKLTMRGDAHCPTRATRRRECYIHEDMYIAGFFHVSPTSYLRFFATSVAHVYARSSSDEPSRREIPPRRAMKAEERRFWYRCCGRRQKDRGQRIPAINAFPPAACLLRIDYAPWNVFSACHRRPHRRCPVIVHCRCSSLLGRRSPT